MKRPRLLYLSPVMPAPSGSGLAMRAFHNLRALATDHDVWLQVIPHSPRVAAAGSELRRMCQAISVLPLRIPGDTRALLGLVLARARPRHRPRAFVRPPELRALSPRRIRSASQHFAGIPFDVIHVFRLYLAPYGFAHRSQGAAAQAGKTQARLQLDLDDVESGTRRSISDCHRARGETAAAASLEREEKLYHRLEARWLPRFDRVFVCSRVDQDRVLESAQPTPVQVVPNIATPGTGYLPGRPGADPFVLLFVGSLGYGPNRDGLSFLLEGVLPVLRARACRPFRIEIVGGGLGLWQRWRLARLPEVTVRGAVAGLNALYRRSNAALVPIRAGGGTRIKAIEAMAHGVPVVSTTVGIEGLTPRPDVEVLIGDTGSAIADQCCRLMTDPTLGDRIARAASAYVAREHTAAVVCAALSGRADP